jgi:hypothetical protein
MWSNFHNANGFESDTLEGREANGDITRSGISSKLVNIRRNQKRIFFKGKGIFKKDIKFC